MIIALTLLTSFYVAYGQQTAGAAPVPGRAIFWSPSDAGNKPQYQTQSASFEEISKLLKAQIANKEILVTFCSENADTNDFFKSSVFSAEIQQSGDATILPNVYQAAKSAKSNICKDILQADGLKETKIATPSEILDLIAKSDILSNKELESFLVQIPSGHESEMSAYKSLFSKLNSPEALFLALQNPSNSAPISGNYHRLLSSDIEDGVNYLPEGSEFSIYYQAQYLYLTPDLFTGIMTGLFMAIALMIGYSCMGAIQGSSSYPSVLPPLGKEG
jgi:hypothetical protein